MSNEAEKKIVMPKEYVHLLKKIDELEENNQKLIRYLKNEENSYARLIKDYEETTSELNYQIGSQKTTIEYKDKRIDNLIKMNEMYKTNINELEKIVNIIMSKNKS